MTLRLNGVTSSVLKSPLLLPLLLLLTVSSSSAFFTDGTKDSYVQYPRWQACLNSSISFEFKSWDTDGLLFYTDDGGQYDFFELRLENRKLMLRFKLTKHRGKIVTSDYKDLDDNRWHKVMIQVNQKETILAVDEFKIGAQVSDINFQFGSLERNNFVFLGGMPALQTPEHLQYLALPSVMFENRWSGQMRNLQYSNCSCPLRSAKIMKLSGARRDNLCETLWDPCYRNNPNCDCLIDASGSAQCNCKDKSCTEENACNAMLSFVKVGSSDQFGCYPTIHLNSFDSWFLYGTQCWRKCTNCTNNHKWCNISNEKCTKSLYKSAKCASKHIHTKDQYGHVCGYGNNTILATKYCDFRTGKRYGCMSSTCWRTCDKTDEVCSILSQGWCYTNIENCKTDEDCLVATTKPCTNEICKADSECLN